MDELNQNENLGTENIEETNLKKGRKLETILTILGVIIVIGLIVWAISMFVSTKNTYFSLVGNGVKSITSSVEDFGDSVFGRILDINMKDKLSIGTEVSANVETNDSEILAWLNGFKNVKLTAYENSDSANNYFDSDMKIILNDEDVILANLLRKNDIFSANVEGITDGYISVDNNRLPELWEKLGYNGPDKFTSQVEFLKGFELSKSEMNDIKKGVNKVGTAFTEAFGKEDFTKGEDTIKYNNKSIDVKYIDFKMNSVELNNGVILALEQLLKEEKTLKALLKLSNAYDNMYMQLGYEVEPFTYETFVKAISDMLEEVKKLEFAEEDGMIIRLYYEGRSIVKIEIFNMNYTSSILKLVMIDDGREKYYEYSNELESYVDNVYMAEEDIWTHTIDINYINYETGDFFDEYGEKIIITVDNSVEDNSKIIMTSEEETTVYTLTGKINGNNKNISFNLEGSDEASTNVITINFNITEGAEFEEKTVDNSFNASDADINSLNAKKDQIIKNWNEFSTKNEDKIVQLYTALSIYMGAMMQESSYSDLVVAQ